MDNPYYISIDIPESEEEKGVASSDLMQAAADILDAANVCSSGTVMGLDLAQRSELEDMNVKGDALSQENEVHLNTVLLSQVHTVKDPIELALKALQEKLTVPDYVEVGEVGGKTEKTKHYIRVHNELVNDYSHNPELISGAFSCLFPLRGTWSRMSVTRALTPSA